MKFYKSKTWLAVMVSKGLSNEEIAKLCGGTSAETIRLYINRFGIKR